MHDVELFMRSDSVKDRDNCSYWVSRASVDVFSLAPKTVTVTPSRSAAVLTTVIDLRVWAECELRITRRVNAYLCAVTRMCETQVLIMIIVVEHDDNYSFHSIAGQVR